jgi:rhodanese-related sulfurtransferase
MRATSTLILFALATCAGYSCTGQPLDLAPTEFKNLLGKQNMVLIDVRTSQELAATGIIRGAKQIDFAAPDFKDKLLALDKSKTYLIYCAVGGRSGQAVQILQANGIKAFNLQGGVNAWKAAGYPLSAVQ